MRAIEKRRLIRPYTSAEVTDTGLRVYRRISRQVLPITLGPMVLASAGILFIWTFVSPVLLMTRKGLPPAQQFFETAAAVAGFGLFALPVIVIGLGAASAPAIRLASQVMMGEKIDLRQVDADSKNAARSLAVSTLNVILRSFWAPLATLGLLACAALVYAAYPDEGVQAIAGFLAAAGFGISFLVAPSLLKGVVLTPVVALLENRTPREAVKRAKLLSRSLSYDSTMGSTVMTSFFTGAVLYSVSSSLASILLEAGGVSAWAAGIIHAGMWGDLVRGFVAALPFMINLWLLAPFWACTMTVLYYDRRVRHEGLDIEVLARDVLHADRQTALLN